jgi:bifunctional non-homologous end joining protein LigD
MSLTRYNEKRNFKSTAEPKGKKEKSTGQLIFVVQKHAASHLHYDFRLEMEGALKSWAVPKGPSMNPADKRLAMMVEDHPYDYKDFEGNIPEGNYGAGNVIVWDRGNYTALDATSKEDERKRLKAGLLKGHLAIVLNGEKLKGEFDLIHVKGKQENAWLLIKKKDAYATEKDILKKNKSVISNVTLETLEKKAPKEKVVFKKKAPSIKKVQAPNKAVGFVAPMLADITEKPFDKEDWVFEMKYDGYRTIAVVNNGDVNLFSRNELSFNTKFKPVAEALKKLPHTTVIDGEVVVEDERGRSSFQLLQQYQKTGKGILKYYVFDIINLDGNDTTGLTLLERKELLQMMLAGQPLQNIFYSEHIEEKGNAFYQSAIKNNLEGIIAKDATSPYRVGKRSSEWLKIKINQQEEAIIIGITGPKGARKNFGAIMLAQYEGKTLKYVGNCGTGFNEATLKELYEQFKPFFTSTPPLKEKVKVMGTVQWIQPKFVAQIKFTERTDEGSFRHPVFLGLRMDKNPGEVKTVNEVTISNTEKKAMGTTKPAAKASAGSDDRDLTIGKTVLHLTNQKKIYYPDDGITKGDIINYYNDIAEVMLPYLKDRPQSMNRFPNGITGQSFYQKDVDIDKIPGWLKTTKVYSESNDKYIDYLLCNDKATLLYMANLGCIEINPWNSTVQHPNNPDWLVIDIDPSKDDFTEVVKTALMVKKVMDEMETECYCKTSGATGLHVYIPMAAKYDYDAIKIFAELIAHTVNVRLPHTTTIIRSIQKREEKIYIDFLQNRPGQTLAAPYSVRPKPGATVSTPLEWKEVNAKLSPSQFTIKNMQKRLDKKGDLWKPVLGKGANIDKILKKIKEDTGALDYK